MSIETVIECENCGKKHYFPANSKMKGRVCKGIGQTEQGNVYRCKEKIVNTGWKRPEIELITKQDLYKPQGHGEQKDMDDFK